MLPYIENKGDCTGCTACLEACPVHCIEMKQDEEGFVYPSASDLCIHCNKCEKVCPIKNRGKDKKRLEQAAYAAVSKNKTIWRQSASGGAFYEICQAYGDEATVVCGAAWDKLEVKHKCVLGVSNIASLQKSKYVASEVGHVFSEIKRNLDEGKKVIFSGTPCQVAGIKNYLGTNYDNLLLIDLICHGVGSPLVFKAAMKVIGEQFGGEVKSYQFRAKRKYFESDHIQNITVKEKNIYVVSDQYIQLFLSQNCLRPSCGNNCRFRTDQREGDITIADFKGLHDVFPETLGDLRNYSTIVFNTAKGKAIQEKLLDRMEID